MKIYTKTGDQGKTGLFGGPRVDKDHHRIEAYGTIDELNAAVGVARALLPDEDIGRELAAIQHDLFAIGAELASPNPVDQGTAWMGGEQIARLEQTIDAWDDELPPLRQFILPSGSPAVASLHVARSIGRRAERRVVTLARQEGETVSVAVQVYLNRLSDLLFVASRRAGALAGIPDEGWQKPDD